MKLTYTLIALLLFGATRVGFAAGGDGVIENGQFSASSMQVEKRVHEGVTLKTSYLPDLAFDGDESTRWSSEFKDDQWIAVDLEKALNCKP